LEFLEKKLIMLVILTKIITSSSSFL
jgi:hypothetical protein